MVSSVCLQTHVYRGFGSERIVAKLIGMNEIKERKSGEQLLGGKKMEDQE